MADSIYRPNGGYKHLLTYQKAEIIFDLTFLFCHRYLQKSDRTFDQMIQAARSGKQNIAEGSLAAATSAATEIHLTNVARASLEELVEDYRDYLRTHHMSLWPKEDLRIQQIRQLAQQKNKTYETYKSYLLPNNPELFCNTMISLIYQTNYLLDRQLQSLAKTFTEKGGIRERMAAARKSYRMQQTEAALELLREIYRDLAKQDNQELMQKIEKAAKLLKERG